MKKQIILMMVSCWSFSLSAADKRQEEIRNLCMGLFGTQNPSIGRDNKPPMNPSSLGRVYPERYLSLSLELDDVSQDTLPHFDKTTGVYAEVPESLVSKESGYILPMNLRIFDLIETKAGEVSRRGMVVYGYEFDDAVDAGEEDPEKFPVGAYFFDPKNGEMKNFVVFNQEMHEFLMEQMGGTLSSLSIPVMYRPIFSKTSRTENANLGFEKNIMVLTSRLYQSGHLATGSSRIIEKLQGQTDSMNPGSWFVTSPLYENEMNAMMALYDSITDMGLKGEIYFINKNQIFFDILGIKIDAINLNGRFSSVAEGDFDAVVGKYLFDFEKSSAVAARLESIRLPQFQKPMIMVPPMGFRWDEDASDHHGYKMKVFFNHSYPELALDNPLQQWTVQNILWPSQSIPLSRETIKNGMDMKKYSFPGRKGEVYTFQALPAATIQYQDQDIQLFPETGKFKKAYSQVGDLFTRQKIDSQSIDAATWSYERKMPQYFSYTNGWVHPESGSFHLQRISPPYLKETIDNQMLQGAVFDRTMTYIERSIADDKNENEMQKLMPHHLPFNTLMAVGNIYEGYFLILYDTEDDGQFITQEFVMNKGVPQMTSEKKLTSTQLELDFMELEKNPKFLRWISSIVKYQYQDGRVEYWKSREEIQIPLPQINVIHNGKSAIRAMLSGKDARLQMIDGKIRYQ